MQQFNAIRICETFLSWWCTRPVGTPRVEWRIRMHLFRRYLLDYRWRWIQEFHVWKLQKMRHDVNMYTVGLILSSVLNRKSSVCPQKNSCFQWLMLALLSAPSTARRPLFPETIRHHLAETVQVTLWHPQSLTYCYAMATTLCLKTEPNLSSSIHLLLSQIIMNFKTFGLKLT